MADKEVVIDDTENDADFDAGFTTPAKPVAAVQTDKPAETVEEPVEPAPPEAVIPPQEETPPAPQPEYVQVTKEQLARLEAAADQATENDKRFKTVFGTLGGIQDIVKKLQAETPKGAAIEISDEDFAEMASEYPDIAKHSRAVLEKVLKNFRGTGVTAAADPDEIARIVDQRVAEGVKQKQVEELEYRYPDWRDIVGAVPNPEQADPNNAFRKWLKTQPADYEKTVRSSHSAFVLGEAIAKFKADTAKAAPPKTPTPAVKTRKDRIASAIPPKGDGNPPPPPKTGDDEFDEGFEARNRRRTG